MRNAHAMRETDRAAAAPPAGSDVSSAEAEKVALLVEAGSLQNFSDELKGAGYVLDTFVHCVYMYVSMELKGAGYVLDRYSFIVCTCRWSLMTLKACTCWWMTLKSQCTCLHVGSRRRKLYMCVRVHVQCWFDNVECVRCTCSCRMSVDDVESEICTCTCTPSVDDVDSHVCMYSLSLDDVDSNLCTCTCTLSA